MGSNNTNKLSPQERIYRLYCLDIVQIIQINLALKNDDDEKRKALEFK